jgi:hypothetical protein
MLCAPAASRAKVKKHTSKSPQVRWMQSGLSCAIGFNGFLRALSGDRLFVTIPGVKRKLHRPVDASVEASRPHDFAVRLSVHSSRAPTASIASRAPRP